MGFYPLNDPILRFKVSGMSSMMAPGKCICDNYLINEIADTVIEALPIIAQIGCYILMSSLKLLLDVGADLIPGVGKILDAGLDMAATAAQVAAYAYPNEQDPEGAFSWWLSPCGGADLVPDEIKKVFGILSQVAHGVSSYKPPKNIKKGSGKKGDDANPTDCGKPGKGNGSGSGSGVGKPPPKKKCKILPRKLSARKGGGQNTLRIEECVSDANRTTEMVITSLNYAAIARATQIYRKCSSQWSQACFMYSLATRVNPHWATLTCPPQAATTGREREDGKATSSGKAQHGGKGWKDPSHRREPNCHMDEYPPAYLLNDDNPAMVYGGKDKRGQAVRYLPGTENSGAGQSWRGACFKPVVADMSDTDFKNAINRAPAAAKQVAIVRQDLVRTLAAVDVAVRPEFVWSEWDHAGNPPADDGMRDNPCWPSVIAPNDPGFAILTFDPWYNNRARPYDFQAAYDPPRNGG